MSWWKFWGDDEEESPDYYAEGVALARQERFHEALTHFRLALREDPDDAATHAQMATAYTHIGMREEAMKAYRKALELEPDHAASHFGIAFLLRERGREEEAAGHLEAFLEAAPREDVPERQLRHARETLERLRSEEAPPPDAGDREPSAGRPGVEDPDGS